MALQSTIQTFCIRGRGSIFTCYTWIVGRHLFPVSQWDHHDKHTTHNVFLYQNSSGVFRFFIQTSGLPFRLKASGHRSHDLEEKTLEISGIPLWSDTLSNCMFIIHTEIDESRQHSLWLPWQQDSHVAAINLLCLRNSNYRGRYQPVPSVLLMWFLICSRCMKTPRT